MKQMGWRNVIGRIKNSYENVSKKWEGVSVKTCAELAPPPAPVDGALVFGSSNSGCELRYGEWHG